ncbi:VOC family protein [Bacillus sp. BRMEA1]|uniref:VOC family protein n=1 Tax=Neobacillus endophyticus TaxID=2738405 RepID=UPI001564E15D|nr:VOC family protein [Neobacillus endophyticus]NRD77818.1 VOC family protein [Neobacillus endophyticus]
MALSFDHLVCFFKKPEMALHPLTQLGIYTVRGGRHETWGTYNMLSYFGLSYIEFLGIENMTAAEVQTENRLISHIVERLPQVNGEGPARIAIRTDHIDDLAESLKKNGFTVFGPIPGERVRTDGEVIRWSLLFPEIAGSGLSTPFFIQWEKPDHVRLAELKEQGLEGVHNLGEVRMESVGVVLRDLEETLPIWEILLSLKSSDEFIDPLLNARCRKLGLPGTELLFCTPVGKGPAEKVLKEKGETPFLVTLSGTKENRLFELLNGWWRLTL